MSSTLVVVCPHCSTANRVPAGRLSEHPTCGKCKASMFTGHPVELDDASFDRHIKRNDIPVVPDFCAPSRAPNGREIARQAGAMDTGNLVRWITAQG